MARPPLYLNQYAHEAPRAVTLPRLPIPEIDIEREAKETAQRFAEYRVIKQGLSAWQEIDRAGSFENWKRIGAALLVGKRRALAITRANAPWGRHY